MSKAQASTTHPLLADKKQKVTFERMVKRHNGGVTRSLASGGVNKEQNDSRGVSPFYWSENSIVLSETVHTRTSV